MSFAYLQPHNDRIQMLVDGAYYSEDGILQKIGDKAYISEDVPMAVITVGHADAGHKIAETLIGLSGCGSFDFAMVLANKVVNGLNRVDWPEHGHVVIFIAGWSETKGPEQYVFTTKSPGNGIEALTLYAAPEGFGNGIPLSPEEMAAIGLTHEQMGNPSPEFFEEKAVAWVEAMRAKPGANYTRPSLPPIRGIGGHLDLITITAEGVSKRRLKTWQDRIGQKIDPDAEPVVVPLTRQQRRAQEREAAKARAVA